MYKKRILIFYRATFQRLMNRVLRQYLEKFIEVYFNNIIIHFGMKEEYTKHVRAVF